MESNLIPSFENFFLEFHDFFEVRDVDWGGKDVGCADDWRNLLDSLFQTLFVYIRQGEFHPQPKREIRGQWYKSLGRFAEEEMLLGEAISEIDALCELNCCSSTDAAASTCDNCDTALVHDWVGGLV